MISLVGAKQQLLLSRVGGGDAARLVMALLTTARRIDAECAALLSGHDLSEGRLAVLLAVSQEPGITPAALAAQLEVTRATVTGLLDGLEAQDLLFRATAEGDRRTLCIRTTTAGERLVESLTPVYANWLNGLVGDIGNEDRAATVRVMESITRALSEGGTR